jgi:hypothetical protein
MHGIDEKNEMFVRKSHHCICKFFHGHKIIFKCCPNIYIWFKKLKLTCSHTMGWIFSHTNLRRLCISWTIHCSEMDKSLKMFHKFQLKPPSLYTTEYLRHHLYLKFDQIFFSPSYSKIEFTFPLFKIV